MKSPQLKDLKKKMKKENQKRPPRLEILPQERWPNNPPGLKEVWLSNKFLVQIYNEQNNVLRLSVCRTMIAGDGGWQQNITWEELMQIKREVCHSDSYAVEVYPGDNDIVNVANMRHLWILPTPVVGWKGATPATPHQIPLQTPG